MPLIPVTKQIEDSIPGIEHLFISARNYAGISALPLNSNFVYRPMISEENADSIIANFGLYWAPLHCPNFECSLNIEPVTDDNGTFYMHTINGKIPSPTPELIVLLGNIQKEGCWSMAKPYNEAAYMIAEDNCFGTLNFEVTTGEGPSSGTRVLNFSIEQKMLVPAEKLTHV